MNHYATPDFWRSYRQLPPEIQRTADKNFRLLAENPHHPSLHFKKIGDDLWSVRIGRRYRALATVESNAYVWFWIGTHAEYDKLV
jgi:mRNA-degrading endonuclease RelE of RelBE toxin-antitoxin system